MFCGYEHHVVQGEQGPLYTSWDPGTISQTLPDFKREACANPFCQGGKQFFYVLTCREVAEG